MDYDIIIIGSGPAGYVAAIRAGQIGLKTALIEKEDIGGMCLNWGCIPSKAMMESAKFYNRILKESSTFGIAGINKKDLSFDWNKAVKRSDRIVNKLQRGVEYLLKKNGVDVIKGQAIIRTENSISVEKQLLKTRNIIIATGTSFPEIKTPDEQLLINIKNLFTERNIPDNIVVAGNNSVSVELAQMFAMIGKNVSLLISKGKFLPLADNYISDFIMAKLKREKINIINFPEITDLNTVYENGELKLEDKTVKCDMLINSYHRKAVIPESDISIKIEKGFIATDNYCQTSVPGIYAIGDVNGKSYFAHIGSAQGLDVINHIKGIESNTDISKYPLNMYTNPEAAQIGLTEEQIKNLGIEYKTGEFPLSANGKALTEGNIEGSIRILHETKYGEVLGVQIIAPHATDMIAEAAAYMQIEGTVYDIAKTVHAHPTVSEIFFEAGSDSTGQAIHK